MNDRILANISYSDKKITYYSGARYDFISELPINHNARILEIGCGTGDTGALALSKGKCDYYCGVEICQKAAKIASRKISEVILADVEKLEFPWTNKYFDALILSEVLEHLVDPWMVLQRLKPFIKNGGVVFASSPNVSHYSVIKMLMGGDWKYAEKGILDRTHLRWFTPKSYRKLFEESGYKVTSVSALSKFSFKAKCYQIITLGMASHLLWRQIDLRATI